MDNQTAQVTSPAWVGGDPSCGLLRQHSRRAYVPVRLEEIRPKAIQKKGGGKSETETS
jgi:hypothetical protein